MCNVHPHRITNPIVGVVPVTKDTLQKFTKVVIEVTSNSLSLCSSEMFESGSQPRPCARFSLVRGSPPVLMLLSYWSSLSQVSRLPCTIPTLFPQRCFQEERNNQCMLSVRLKCKDLCVELLEKKSESLKATTSSNRYSAYGSCTWH